MAEHLDRRTLGQLTLALLAGCKRPAGSEGRTASATAAGSAAATTAATATAAAAAAAGEAGDRPIRQVFAGVRGSVPWLMLGELPTPVERAEGLGRALGMESLYVKRDDLAGSIYGGGKVRKLEVLLAAASAAGARGVVTLGGVGSNQAVATALYGAAAGFAVTLLLAPQRPGEHVRANLLAAHRAGAELRLVPQGVGAAEAQAQAEARRGGPYVIPPGGSSPLANLSFVNAGLELAAQVAAGQMPEPDLIYLAMGTMGSAVGLSLGLAAAGLRSEVVAVRASSPETSSAGRLRALEQATVAQMQKLGATLPEGRGRVRVVGNQLGAGYGAPTASGRQAVALASEQAGWTLEPTYTGKALAALIAEAPTNRGKVVLFWLSHSSRPLRTEGADPRGLPAAFRPYVEGG